MADRSRWFQQRRMAFQALGVAVACAGAMACSGGGGSPNNPWSNNPSPPGIPNAPSCRTRRRDLAFRSDVQHRRDGHVRHELRAQHHDERCDLPLHRRRLGRGPGGCHPDDALCVSRGHRRRRGRQPAAVAVVGHDNGHDERGLRASRLPPPIPTTRRDGSCRPPLRRIFHSSRRPPRFRRGTMWVAPRRGRPRGRSRSRSSTPTTTPRGR